VQQTLEKGPLDVLVGQREQLLELVDHQQQLSLVRGTTRRRAASIPLLTAGELVGDSPVVVAHRRVPLRGGHPREALRQLLERRCPGRHRGHQPPGPTRGSHRPAPGAPTRPARHSTCRCPTRPPPAPTPVEPGAAESADQFLDELVPTEEVRRIGLVERPQSLVRVDRHPGVRREPGRALEVGQQVGDRRRALGRHGTDQHVRTRHRAARTVGRHAPRGSDRCVHQGGERDHVVTVRTVDLAEGEVGQVGRCRCRRTARSRGSPGRARSPGRPRPAGPSPPGGPGRPRPASTGSRDRGGHAASLHASDAARRRHHRPRASGRRSERSRRGAAPPPAASWHRRPHHIGPVGDRWRHDPDHQVTFHPRQAGRMHRPVAARPQPLTQPVAAHDPCGRSDPLQRLVVGEDPPLELLHSGDGSSPVSRPSTFRYSRITPSASACRPLRYSATISWARNDSRNGSRPPAPRAGTPTRPPDRTPARHRPAAPR
jgi:hypothetical protein